MNATPTKHIIICYFFLSAILSFYACSKKDSPPPPKVDTAPKIAITSLNADSGVYNASVTITGTGFDKTVANDKVFFNGKAATITAATSTQLTVLVPLAAGTGKVSVKVNDGTEINGPMFNYKQSWIVSTFAGSGAAGFTDGDGTGATLNQPVGITIDGNGDFFITEQGNHAVRKITAAGKVTTIAGNGNSGKVNGKGAAASFDHPAGIRSDKAGNLYIADYANNMIRKIDASEQVTTVAGTGIQGFDNGPGSSATFRGPIDLVLNKAGEIFVADFANEILRKITTGGVVSTFSKIVVPGATGLPNAFHFPSGLAIDANDNIFVVDQLNFMIQKITPLGNITTFAGSGTRGVVNAQGTKAGFYTPYQLTIDKNGNFYVTDMYQIRKIDKDVNVTLFAGVTDHGSVNGAAAVSSFYTPIGIVTDQDGNVYVADTSNNLIRKIAFQ